MPPAQFPPTPGSSTDIRGLEKTFASAPVLELPPAAYCIDDDDRVASSTPSSNNDSDCSYHPASPPSPRKTQRKQAFVSQPRSTKVDDAFVLPPPPSRPRKIIQMKPKGSQSGVHQENCEEGSSVATTATRGKKKGKDGNTTAAGRKIARKTAHSLIERRRRSKMNEEFGVLKDMIPACDGLEMHKLAILQASIDYVRYLEKCVSDLKTRTVVRQEADSSESQPEEHSYEAMDADSNSEGAMDEGNGVLTPNIESPIIEDSQSQPRTSAPSLVSLPSMSQFMTHTGPSSSFPADQQSRQQHRHYSISSASQASYSPYIYSNQASPFFGPSYSGQDPSAFALTSPALRAQDARNGCFQQVATGDEARQQRERHEEDLDKEAMAALLMLNSDPRNWKDSSARALSVRDLLSN